MRRVPLELGVKPPQFWRLVDPNFGQRNTKFDRALMSTLTRYQYTCAGCGFRSQPSEQNPEGFLQVHHLDHNHSNSDPNNLVPACPMCHAVFHIGFPDTVSGHDNLAREDTGATKNKGQPARSLGDIAVIPGLSQVHLINIARTVGVVRVLDRQPQVTMAEDVWQQIMRRTEETSPLLNGFSGDSRVFSAWLQVAPARLTDNFAKQFPEVLFVPDLDHFTDCLSYWAFEVYAKKHPPESWGELLEKLAERMKQVEANTSRKH